MAGMHHAFTLPSVLSTPIIGRSVSSTLIIAAPIIAGITGAIIPEIVSVTKNFLKPMLVVLIEAPIVLIVLGPLGAICGNVLSDNCRNYRCHNT